jgi:hypothetical protein
MAPMNLEQASYIFGIVGSIATVIGLYFAWQAHRLKREGGGQPAQILPTEKKEALIASIATSSADDELRIVFESTKKMNRYAERDSALVPIARKALATTDWRLALEVAETMTFKANKDALLGEIVDGAIKAKEWRVADAASDLMFFWSSKDSAKRRIAESVSK